MEYINYKPFKEKAICGDVDFPALTVFQSEGGMIYHEGKPLCVVTSANAHKFFARNDDGCGEQRGKLITKIKEMLSNEEEGRDEFYQIRWDAVWEDAVCNQYRRSEHQDHFLWNHAFYNASIEQLEHILSVVENAKYEIKEDTSIGDE